MQKVFIQGAISSETVDSVRYQLAEFDNTQPLTIEINSDGGAVADGVAIYNMVRDWPGGVTTEVIGWALSIASVISQAGSRRCAHESALMMVHAPWTSLSGNAAALRSNATLLDQVGQTMLGIYRRTGQPDATILGWLDGEDHWFTATEALAAGLIDDVISDSAQAPFANAQLQRHKVPTIFSRKVFMQPTTTVTPATHGNTMQAGIQAEAVRRNEIKRSFGKFASHAGVPDLMAQCESDPTCTVEAAGIKLLAKLGANSAPVAGHYTPAIHSGDRLQDFKAAATDALLQRVGIAVSEPHPGAADLKRFGITAMAESVLSMTGKLDRNMSASAIISAALSTSDFPSLLGNVANKALAIGYDEAPSGHAIFTGERDVSDFKTNTLVNLSEAPGLEKVPELAEYHHGAMSDSASTFQLATYGKILKISRQMLVNDDTAAFTRLPQSFGAAARRLEADHVFAILNDNGLLGDGFALFSAEHKNLGNAAVLSLASLGAARSAMRLQKGLADLSYIDVQPKYLIVPVALETTAEQLLASLVDPVRTNATPNLQFIRGLTLVADPRLDATSTTAWYLSADPRQIEGILRAYLSGQPRPFLDEDHEFKTDAISYKVRLDFAAGVVDFRGMYKNPGA